MSYLSKEERIARLERLQGDLAATGRNNGYRLEYLKDLVEGISGDVLRHEQHLMGAQVSKPGAEGPEWVNGLIRRLHDAEKINEALTNRLNYFQNTMLPAYLSRIQTVEYQIHKRNKGRK